jgi:hypothetical protein
MRFQMSMHHCFSPPNDYFIFHWGKAFHRLPAVVGGIPPKRVRTRTKKAPTRVCRSLFRGALTVDPITDVAELSGSVLTVASQVFDRLAVLRQGTRYQQGHLGAQLGDLTNGVLYALFKPQGVL